MFESLLNTIKYFFTFILLGTQTLIKPVAPERNIFVETYPNAAIDSLWLEYSDKIQTDGRTLDRDRNLITTSEGQSYSLLRAVWMDDKDTFDRVLNWTNNNLRKRPDDKLFAWKWGQDDQGNWGVLYDEGGINTASDADQDIALALIFAYKRWNEERYLIQAKQVLTDIWEVEVITVNEKPYLLAGNWAKNEELPTINPSYFSFAAYPIFAEVDPSHPWMQLRDTSYDVLKELGESPIHGDKTVGLPPDWAAIDPTTGKLIKSVHKDKTTEFSDDAIRVIWRVGLDWRWYENPRAKSYLESLSYLEKTWNENGLVYSSYAQDGVPTADYESNSLYGATIPYFQITNPELGKEIYFKKIISLYDHDLEEFKGDLGYYSQNWVWFGIAFYENKLPNLYVIEGSTT